MMILFYKNIYHTFNFYGKGNLHGVKAKLLDSGLKSMKSKSNVTLTFDFGLMPKRKVWTP